VDKERKSKRTKYNKDVRDFLKGDIMKKKIIWYLFGLVTTPFILFILLVILFLIGVKPSLSRGDLLVSRWQLFEEDKNTLVMRIPGYENVCFVISVERNPKHGLVEEIGVINSRSQHCNLRNEPNYNPPSCSLLQCDVNSVIPLFPIFVYRNKGRYGVPMMVYGSPDKTTGLVWRDFKADNRWDQKIDYKNKLMEINVGGRWIKGLISVKDKDEVITTEKGLFKFDVESGKWQIVDPNASLE
jgi:hypothetical protein